MKALKDWDWDWERLKTITEVVAIFGAAMFALFTWGIDSARVTSPNWAVSFGDMYQYSAVIDNGHSRICVDAECKAATTCRIQSRIVTKNEGRTPLTIGLTEVDFYLVNKERESGFVNASSYRYYEAIKTGKSTDSEKIGFVKIGSVDEQPLYPGQEAWRPFSIEVTPGLLNEKLDLDEFAKKKQLLIVAKQNLTPSSIWPFNSEEHSMETYLVSNVCFRANLPSDKQCNNKDECTTKQMKPTRETHS